MTAHAMKGDRELCLAAGMDGYIAMPLRQQEVITVLRQALSKPASLPASASQAVAGGENAKTARSTGRLNWQQALRTVAGDTELLREVLTAFLEEGPELQATLRAGTASGDWLTVAKTSHTLQAALRLFGGQALDLAVALESRPGESLQIGASRRMPCPV
jgi:HPt (histidine-containing phosphotransfer) domain-containing protein